MKKEISTILFITLGNNEKIVVNGIELKPFKKDDTSTYAIKLKDSAAMESLSIMFSGDLLFESEVDSNIFTAISKLWESMLNAYEDKRSEESLPRGVNTYHTPYIFDGTVNARNTGLYYSLRLMLDEDYLNVYDFNELMEK